MLKIRLSRFGKKHCPFYRVVVIDSRRKRDSMALDLIGHYDPSCNKILLNQEKYSHYLKHGAQPTETVERLYKLFSKAQKTEISN